MTSAATKTILVVDDDRDVLSMAEDMLRTMMRYTVIGTIDPGVALRHALMPGAIDLRLTDVAMPLMGGGQLAQEFRQLRPNAKVLFMSAYDVLEVEVYGVKLRPASRSYRSLSRWTGFNERSRPQSCMGRRGRVRVRVVTARQLLRVHSILWGPRVRWGGSVGTRNANPRKRKCGMEFWVERGSGETVGDFIFRGVHRRAQSEANRLFDAGCLEVRGWH